MHGWLNLVPFWTVAWFPKIEAICMSDSGDLVWTSDKGYVRKPGVGKTTTSSKRKGKSLPDAGFPNDGVTRVRRETGGRGGKTVTVLYGVPGSDDERTRLFKELKKQCGCGGTFKEGRIEIQGDQRDKILAMLAQKNIQAKAAGG
ncbi:MAG: translation initiation factor 1 [Candidatus Promineifilaceae bacterium]|jgi:translation initiation factor 1